MKTLKFLFVSALLFAVPSTSFAAINNLNGLTAGTQVFATSTGALSPHLIVQSVSSTHTFKWDGVPWAVAQGGTGSSTLSGILVGNGTSFLKSLNIGTGLSFDGSTLTASGTGIAQIGPAGQLQSGSVQTLSTTTSSFNGLSLSTLITAASNVINWNSFLSGILGVGGGGTGLSSVPDGALLMGAGTSTLAALATSSPGDVLQVDLATGRPSWVATSSLGIQTGGNNSKNPTYQLLTSTATSTYTTPAGVTELHIKMVGAGGGGAYTNIGGDGTQSWFGNSGTITSANGGTAGGIWTTPSGGLGGSSGASLLGSVITRITGGGGGGGGYNTYQGSGGVGGSSVFGGAGASVYNGPGGDAAPNSGGGGAGCGNANQAGGGGGAGEYVEFIVTSPASTYDYQVGTGGAAGSGIFNGSWAYCGKGADGQIIVEELYN